MDPLRPDIVILSATHEPLTQALIHPEHDLGRDLRAQERRLLRPGILPLREILRHPRDLDAGGGLVVAGLVGQVLLAVDVVVLELELLVEGGREVVRGGGGGEEERVDAAAGVVGGRRLGQRRVGARGGGGGEVGGELRGEHGGAGRGDEVLRVEGGQECVFEAWVGDD